MSTTVALLATMLVATANPAQAVEPESLLDPGDVVTAASLQHDAEQFMAALPKLEPHIERAKNGTLRIRTNAVQVGISQHTFQQVSASVREVNMAVLRGELTTTADLQVLPAGPTAMHNGVIFRWWGVEVHFTQSTAQGLIGLIAAGAGVATLAAVITAATGVGALAFGIAAALLAIGGGALQFCSRNGTGVKVFNPHVGPPWCTNH